MFGIGSSTQATIGGDLTNKRYTREEKTEHAKEIMEALDKTGNVIDEEDRLLIRGEGLDDHELNETSFRGINLGPIKLGEFSERTVVSVEKRIKDGDSYNPEPSEEKENLIRQDAEEKKATNVEALPLRVEYGITSRVDTKFGIGVGNKQIGHKNLWYDETEQTGYGWKGDTEDGKDQKFIVKNEPAEWEFLMRDWHNN
jgi:hypothetical protein